MVQEQPTITEERPTTLLEQALPVAEQGAEGVAEAMASAVAEFDLSTPEGVKAAAEKFPALKAWREDGYGSGLEAGRRETERKYTRDQASSERVMEVAKDMYERMGVDLDPDSLQTLTRLTRGNADAARLEVMQHMAEEAMGMTESESERSMLQSLIDGAEGNADEMQKVATMAVSAVANRSKSAALDALTLDELLKNEKHRKAIDDLVAQRMQEEAEARAIESRRTDAAPEPPAGVIGTPKGVTQDRLNAMSPDSRREYFASLSDEERGDMWSLVLGTAGR